MGLLVQMAGLNYYATSGGKEPLSYNYMLCCTSYFKTTPLFFMSLSKSIILSKILLIGSCNFLLSVSIGYSQHNSSLFSWQHDSFLNETASLAMSNSALTHFINPAVGGRKYHLQFRSNLGASSPYSIDFDAAGYEPNLTNFGLSFTDQRFWVAFSAEDFNFTWFDQGTNRFQSFRLHAGYQLNSALSIGFGTGINRTSLPEVINHTNSGGRPSQKQYSLSFDFGLYYSESFKTSRFIIQPETGLSLNNIGDYHKYELDVWPQELHAPQAGQLSWSSGLSATTKDEWRGRSWVSAGVYAGLNKYFSRMPAFEGGRGNGFRDLFTNWGSFEQRDYPNENVSANDQISLGLGVKISILETLSVQYGRLSGADLWVRSRQSWGIGLEYSYFSVNMTGINYQSEARWDDNSSLLFYEVIVNLPLSIFKF